MAKVTVVGATGNVGAFAAHTIAEIPYVSDLLLMGRPGRGEILEGLVSDLIDSLAACGNSTRIRWSTDLADIAGSEIVVCTAGTPRRPGQDRLDLARENATIVADIAEAIGRIAPGTLILVVTNPVDIMTAVALKWSGMMPQQVFGLGTHLDSMRLKSLIATHFNVHVSEVHTRIIGEHGDSMVPLWSATTIGGVQISNLTAFHELPISAIVNAVKGSGARIIEQKGSTVFGPGEAIASLVRTVLGDENRILTVSTHIMSEIHGIGGICIGVPARINKNGVFPVAIRIDDEELAHFRESVEKLRQITDTVLESYGRTQGRNKNLPSYGGMGIQEQ
jgi:malate dehydrogenase